jgi:hypothetical protein
VKGDASYHWGPPVTDGPAAGLSVGLAIRTTRVKLDSTLRWRWAIRNDGESVREVALALVDDPVFRCRLQVSKSHSEQVVWEFSPPSAVHGDVLSRRVTLVTGHPVELPGGDASIDNRWGAGGYRLQLVFGGGPYQFECRSGVVNVVAY